MPEHDQTVIGESCRAGSMPEHDQTVLGESCRAGSIPGHDQAVLGESCRAGSMPGHDQTELGESCCAVWFSPEHVQSVPEGLYCDWSADVVVDSSRPQLPPQA